MRNLKKYCWVFVILLLVWQPLWADNVVELPIDPAEEFGDDPPPSEGSIDSFISILLMFLLGTYLSLRRFRFSK